MDELVCRLAALEAREGSPASIGNDMRVIEMQIARAEEKILRLGRAASWIHPELNIFMTEYT